MLIALERDKGRALVRVPIGDEDTKIACLAGEALAKLRSRSADDACPSRHLVDAVVMACAASNGDVVYTSDVEDLMGLQAFFRGVRILAV
jgi:hypothetical protein